MKLFKKERDGTKQLPPPPDDPYLRDGMPCRSLLYHRHKAPEGEKQGAERK